MKTYACYYVHADTGERNCIYCQGVKEYKPGDIIPASNGKDYIIVDFKMEG